MLAWYPSAASDISDDELLNPGRNKGESSRCSYSSLSLDSSGSPPALDGQGSVLVSDRVAWMQLAGAAVIAQLAMAFSQR